MLCLQQVKPYFQSVTLQIVVITLLEWNILCAQNLAKGLTGLDRDN